MPISYNPDTRMYSIPIREVCNIIEKIPMHRRHKGAQHAFTILALDPDRVMNVTYELFNTWLGKMKVTDQEEMVQKYSVRNAGVYVKNPTKTAVYIPQIAIDKEIEDDEEIENLVGGSARDSDFMIEVDYISKEEFRELEHKQIMDEWSRLQNEEEYGTD